MLQQEAIVSAFDRMQLDAVNIGRMELSRPPDSVQRLLRKGAGVKLVSSNASFKTNPGAGRSYRIMEAAGLKIGVIGLVDDTLAHTPSDSKGDVVVRDAFDGASESLDQLLRQGPDLVVALVDRIGRKNLKRLIEDGRIDLYLGVDERDVNSYCFKRPKIQGRKLGRIAVTRTGDRFSFKFDELDVPRETEDHAEVAPLLFEVRERKNEYAKQMRKRKFSEARVVRYAGNWSCFSCHEDAYEPWLESDHSRAWRSLNPEQQSDVTCASCHVTGQFKPGGFLDSPTMSEVLEENPKILENEEALDRVQKSVGTAIARSLMRRNVGCEACHGTGEEHVQAMRRYMRGQIDEVRMQNRRKMRLPGPDWCMTCHDVANSPDFDFSSYWAKIAH